MHIAEMKSPAEIDADLLLGKWSLLGSCGD
jgi:hypothetical protein